MKPLTSLDTDHLSTLHQIRRWCEGFARRCPIRHAIDLDQLAIDIYMEHLTHGHPLTYTFTRSRFIDALRMASRRLSHTRIYADMDRTPRLDFGSDNLPLAADVVETLMKRAGLTSDEYLLLYQRFWEGMIYKDIGVLWGWPEATTKERVERIVEKLRDSSLEEI